MPGTDFDLFVLQLRCLELLYVVFQERKIWSHSLYIRGSLFYTFGDFVATNKKESLTKRID